MPEPTIPITETELYRLEVAYTSIEDPVTRNSFLRTLEEWVLDQYRGDT